MNNFSKIVISSSIVLTGILFSIGCGGDSFCCEDGEPPIPKIAVDGRQINLESDETKLVLDGLSQSEDLDAADGGHVVKCNWYVADENGENKKLVLKDICQNAEIDFSSYDRTVKYQVCLEVIDNDGISSTSNNGLLESDKVGPSIEKDGSIDAIKKYDCKVVALSPQASTSTPDTSFSIYNTNTTQLVSNSAVKQACPYYIKPNKALPDNTTCSWTKDGTQISTDCTGVTNLSDNDLNSHSVCLTINGDANTKECQDIRAVEHDAPTADIKVYDKNTTDKQQITTLPNEAFDKIYLSCADSKNDCPGDNSRLECTWTAKSYDSKNLDGSCNTSDPHFDGEEDCYADHDGHTHGDKVTDAQTMSWQTLCSEDVCIMINLEVKDTISGKTDTTNIQMDNIE